jgi:hypothetical protein
MVKHAAPAFTESGGWQFKYFPAADDAATHQACATCHRAARSKDFVFGTYGR